MLKKLRNKIESKRRSNNLFWGSLVFAKDVVWKTLSPIMYASSILGPVYYFDPFLKKKVNLRKRLSPKNRKPGISGFMRLRNEEEFVGRVIESVINILDELVIVYNRCTDKTPEIVEKYKKKYPSKIKIYHYKPKVYPQGSKEHAVLPTDSPHSLVNYYNFALAKTTHKIAVKIDGDDLFVPELFRATVNEIKKNNLNEFLGFFGINLWDKNGRIYVNLNKPTIGWKDRGFFPVNKNTYHIKTPGFEHLTHNLNMRNLGVLFFHMKGMKKDRGIGVYDLDDNPDSDYHEKVRKWYTNPKLIPWKEFKKIKHLVKNVPNPNSLGWGDVNKR